MIESFGQTMSGNEGRKIPREKKTYSHDKVGLQAAGS